MSLDDFDNRNFDSGTHDYVTSCPFTHAEREDFINRAQHVDGNNVYEVEGGIVVRTDSEYEYGFLKTDDDGQIVGGWKESPTMG